MCHGRQSGCFSKRGAAPTAEAPNAIRNVVLVGPSGAGKTTLVDALLVAGGVLNRPGSVTEGTTVCDFDDAEIRQQRSVGLAVASLAYDGIKINLIDTPVTPTSWANCVPGCVPPTARCSSSRPMRASTSRPSRCGRNAPRSACPEPWCSRSSTTPAPTT